MDSHSLSMLSDAEVMERLEELLGNERQLTAAVLVHLGEVEARRLYLPAACSSMHVYCTRVLRMSVDQSFKRIRAARAMRRYPVVASAVMEGRLHLIGVLLLAPHLTDQNAAELVAEASGKSKSEIEVLLARWAPRPDVPQLLEPLPDQTGLVAPERAGRIGANARLTPLSPGRFALQLTISDQTRCKLARLGALLSHQVPSGDLSVLFDLALDSLLAKVEKKKLGKTCAPRSGTASRVKRYVPHEVRRHAVARDGLQCSFISEDGRRCDETRFLEFDHVIPIALGGDSTDGVRVLCRAHNRFEAERLLGRHVVEAGRVARARHRKRLREVPPFNGGANSSAAGAAERVARIDEKAAKDGCEPELVARSGEEVVLEDRGLLLDAVVDEVAVRQESVPIGAGVAATAGEEGAHGAGDDVDADRGLPHVSDFVDQDGATLDGRSAEVFAIDGVGCVDGVAQRDQGARALQREGAAAHHADRVVVDRISEQRGEEGALAASE